MTKPGEAAALLANGNDLSFIRTRFDDMSRDHFLWLLSKNRRPFENDDFNSILICNTLYIIVCDGLYYP